MGLAITCNAHRATRSVGTGTEEYAVGGRAVWEVWEVWAHHVPVGQRREGLVGGEGVEGDGFHIREELLRRRGDLRHTRSAHATVRRVHGCSGECGHCVSPGVGTDTPPNAVRCVVSQCKKPSDLQCTHSATRSVGTGHWNRVGGRA
jgi:hypothetical protein